MSRVEGGYLEMDLVETGGDDGKDRYLIRTRPALYRFGRIGNAGKY